uniref:CID domain-containing protein n=1 Tax=Trichuris muris TaxID=70415 RepID=A0A5S6QEL5_TRIMR
MADNNNSPTPRPASKPESFLSPAITDEVARAKAIKFLTDQMRMSKENLNAQWNSIMCQQDNEVREAIQAAENEMITRMSTECGTDLNQLAALLASLKEKCTKESILHCNTWITKNSGNQKCEEVIMRYLLAIVKHTRNTAKFKLYILYVVNDLLHNWSRKQSFDMLAVLSRFVPQMFAYAWVFAVGEQFVQEKLTKLREIWDKQHYLDGHTFSSYEDAEKIVIEHQAAEVQEFEPIVSKIFQQFDDRYRQYEAQHLQFVRFTEEQVDNIINKRPTNVPLPPTIRISATNFGLDPRVNSSLSRPVPSTVPADTVDSIPSNPSGSRSLLGTCPPRYSTQPIPPFQHYDSNEAYSRPMPFNQPPPAPMFRGGNAQFGPPFFPTSYQRPLAVPPRVPMESGNFRWRPNEIGRFQFPVPRDPSAPVCSGRLPLPFFMNTPPPRLLPPTSELPHAHCYDQPPIVPRSMYYDLPAGVMLPMVPLEASEYEPIDPESVRIPVPVPPTERLFAALDGFYNEPRHEAPREFEGWEKLGMYEYYLAKEKALAAKMEREKAAERSIQGSSTSADNSQRSTSYATDSYGLEHM